MLSHLPCNLSIHVNYQLWCVYCFWNISFSRTEGAMSPLLLLLTLCNTLLFCVLVYSFSLSLFSFFIYCLGGGGVTVRGMHVLTCHCITSPYGCVTDPHKLYIRVHTYDTYIIGAMSLFCTMMCINISKFTNINISSPQWWSRLPTRKGHTYNTHIL